MEFRAALVEKVHREGLERDQPADQERDLLEQLVEVARSLREDHDFRGYIHLKTIPEASEGLIAAAGRYADRLSVNIELPSREALKALAPEKTDTSIKRAMGEIRWRTEAAMAGLKEGQMAP